MNEERVNKLPFLDRITDYVDYYAAEMPDQEAVVYDDLRWSYRDLKKHVDIISKALLAHGICKGDRVATLSPPNQQFWSIFLASASIGAIWQGLNPRYKLEEYQHLVSDSLPKILLSCNKVADRIFASDLKLLRAQNKSLSHLVLLDDKSDNDDFETFEKFCSYESQVSNEELYGARKKVKPNDPALIVYTSGSTGKPKGALLPHRGLVRCSRNQLGYYDVFPVRLENFYPINHVACVGDISCFALVAGGTIFFMENFDPENSLAQISKEKITLWGGIPTTLQLCLASENFPKYDLSSIQLISWGGGPASESLISKLLEITPRLTSCYGLTETVGSVTFINPTNNIKTLTNTIGQPVPGYEVTIKNKGDQDIPDGEMGEICIRGDFIMTGYWGKPEATAKTIDPEGWLHTGDLALKLPDGNLKFLGRMGEMFKSGGYNIHPREIEQTIEMCDGVEAVAVISASDELYGEIGIAYVQKKSRSTLSQEDIHQHCCNMLANYKVPKLIIFRDQMPLLPVGKIDKSKLKTEYFWDSKTK